MLGAFSFCFFVPKPCTRQCGRRPRPARSPMASGTRNQQGQPSSETTRARTAWHTSGLLWYDLQASASEMGKEMCRDSVCSNACEHVWYGARTLRQTIPPAGIDAFAFSPSGDALAVFADSAKASASMASDTRSQQGQPGSDTTRARTTWRTSGLLWYGFITSGIMSSFNRGEATGGGGSGRTGASSS